MPLDPSIILGGQAPQFKMPDALDQATKLMNLQDLALKTNTLQKTASDSATMSQILKNNTKIDPVTGAPSIDRQGALSDTYKFNPQKGEDLRKQFLSQDVDTQNQQHALGKELIFQATPDNWPQIRQKGIQMGLPWQSTPEVAGDHAIQVMQIGSLNGEDQIKKMESDRTASQKDREGDQKDTQLGIEQEKNQIERAKTQFDQHEKYVQHVEDQEQKFRSGDPASNMASMRIGAAAAGKSIIDKYRGHEDDMPIQDLYSLATEKVKGTSGATPTEADIAAQVPHTLATKIAEWKSGITSGVEPANAGDFVRHTDGFLKDIEGTSRNYLGSRNNQIASNPRLTPEEKQRLTALPPKVYQDTVQMRDPKGNIREVPIDQVEAAKKAGGTPL